MDRARMALPFSDDDYSVPSVTPAIVPDHFQEVNKEVNDVIVQGH